MEGSDAETDAWDGRQIEKLAAQPIAAHEQATEGRDRDARLHAGSLALQKRLQPEALSSAVQVLHSKKAVLVWMLNNE